MARNLKFLPALEDAGKLMKDLDLDNACNVCSLANILREHGCDCYYMYVCMYVSMYVCVCVSECVYVSVISVCMLVYVRMYVCMYVCMYVLIMLLYMVFDTY